MSKNAFVVTINPGYTFSLNSNFNANKFYGTNADFHVLYHEALEKDYRDRCSNAFDFNIIWTPLNGSYFSAKYKYVEKIKDDYDAVCIIDGDLFICSNVKEYFQKAFDEKVLVASTHVWAGCPVESLPFGHEEKMNDRGICCLADLSVFFDPKKHLKFTQDWYKFTEDKQSNTQRNHPLVAFNRAVCNNFTADNVIGLDGEVWVGDRNFWAYEHYIKDNMLHTDKFGRVYAIHNRWWQHGRAASELRVNKNSPLNENVLRGEKNFNTIKDFMATFNNMTPATYWDHYLKEKIVAQKIWKEME